MITKIIQFNYTQDGVTLAFSFADDADLKRKMETFLGLLLKAEDEVRKQIDRPEEQP